MKPIFKDIELQKQFDRDGYVIVDNMLGAEQMRQLGALFHKISPAHLDRLYINMFDRSNEENIEISNAIVTAFAPRVHSLTENCRLETGVFITKGIGEQGVCDLHQDWNCVDEERFVSISIWCPLVDVDENSGCLYVVKGSHRMFRSVRTITLKGLALAFDDELEPLLTPLPVKAGQAVLYAHNLFHGSKPIYSGNARVAAVGGIFPNDAQIIHYYKNDAQKGLIEIFDTPKDFYINNISKYYDMKRPDDLRKIGEFHCNDCTITRENFFETVRSKAEAM